MMGRCQVFKKILCPIDFSELTKFQLDYARGLAQLMGSKIAALYVLRLPLDVHEMQSWDVMYREWERRAKESMKTYCNDDITPLFSENLNEAHKIVQLAEEDQFDLILMPTHGYHGLQKALLGSVFQEILLRSHIPVLALPPKFVTLKQSDFKKPLNILCAIDLQEGSEKLVQFTETLARQFGATFSIFHSIDLKTEFLRLLDENTFEDKKVAARKKVLQIFPHAHNAAEVFVSHEAPYKSILSTINDRVDLVVLGYSLKSQMRLRSTLYRVIAELSVPALCVPID
jgi:universal stress protein A